MTLTIDYTHRNDIDPVDTVSYRLKVLYQTRIQRRYMGPYPRVKKRSLERTDHLLLGRPSDGRLCICLYLGEGVNHG